MLIIGHTISPCTAPPNRTHTYTGMKGLQVCIANKKLTAYTIDVHCETERSLRHHCHISNIYIQGLVSSANVATVPSQIAAR